ncbi:MAG: response regulator [Pedobacter sp.]|nr:MAG: response regulator [Pedobacter sp.]
MRETIYLLEDDKDIGFIIQYFLTEEGFNVELFDTVSECRIAMMRTLPDLCLFDIMLPDGDGIVVCNQLKSNPLTHDVPVMLMSAHARENIVNKNSQADIFIEKPFDLNVLLNGVKQLLPQAS